MAAVVVALHDDDAVVVGLVERTEGDVDVGGIMNAEPKKGKAAMDAMKKTLVVDDIILLL